LAELKKKFEKNKALLEKNKTKIVKLEGNIEQAGIAVKMKNELKKDLESKGKKISEESKKWINEISKLNDKHEDLKKNHANLVKDEEAAKNQHIALEKRLAEINREKVSYEAEYKTLNGKL
jgi:chromosome segregation ATPase